MGKVVAKIAKVVAIAAVIVGTVYTAGALGFGFAAAGLRGAAAAVFKVTAIRTAFTVAAFSSAIGASLTKPKLDIGEQTSERTQLNLNPSPRRKWVFGQTAAAMDMYYAENYGDNDEISTIAIVHAGHLITSYERMWIDGEIVTFSGNNATGRWDGLLTREQKLGATSQTALSINAGAIYTSTETASGTAVQALTFTADAEQNPRGVPSRIVQEIKGSPVYDPRLDSTEGGSGSHRADDQDTWEYLNGGTDIGRNAALVYLTYLIGWLDSGDIVLGVGIPVDDILYDTFIEAANVCETNSWFFDGFVADGDHRRNLRSMLNSFAGSPLEIGGKFGVRAPFDDTAVIALAVDGDRIMGQVHREGPPPFRGRVNIAVGRYVEPDNAFQPEEYATVTLSDLVTIDGSELPITLDFLGTQDTDTAQQLAGVMMREARQPSVRLVIDQSGLGICPGQIISVTLPEVGFDGTLIRVASHNFSFEDLTTAIMGNIVVASDYDLVTPGTAGDSLTPSVSKFDELVNAVNLTGLTAVAVDITTLFGTVTSTENHGFALGWDNPGVQILETQIQYKPTAESDFIEAPSVVGDTNGAPNTAVIVSIIADTVYDIRARHINLAGFPGDFDTIQEDSSITPLLPPINLNLTQELTLGSDTKYRTTITFSFDPTTNDLNVLEYEAQFKYPRNSEFQPLYKSLDPTFTFTTAELGLIEVRVRSVYITDLIFSAYATTSITSVGTATAIAAIGITTPVDAKFFYPDVLDKTPVPARVEVTFDDTGSAAPDFLVIFYAWEDQPNQLAIGTDNGSDKLFLDPSNVDTGIAGTFILDVIAGSTDNVINYVDNNDDPIDFDQSGQWWVAVDSGTQRTRYHKIVESSANQLTIPPEETLDFVPNAGDTIEVIELDWHDSRLDEFKLVYFANGEIVKHNGIQFDGALFFLDAVTRGAEGTVQADQSGNLANYFPAYGPDTSFELIDLARFDNVDGDFIVREELDINIPIEFGWAAISCCFVTRASASDNVEFVRSNIVPMKYGGPL